MRSNDFSTVSLDVDDADDGVKSTIMQKPDESLRQTDIFQNVIDSADNNIFIVGKLFNTYILAQKDDCLYMIDQHAAHERLLYDKYVESIDNNTLSVQDLLLPYVFEVSHSEYDMIENSIEELLRAGFIISPFGGNSFSLSGVPSMCYDINLKEFVSLLLEKINENKIKKSEFVKEAVAQSACKAAVKGKEDLTAVEIDSLISAMSKNGGVLLCPHGRPTVIQIKRSEIEKWFKRIV